MLGEHPIHTTLPASDIQRAKQFYSDTLGLSVENEAPDGILFRSGNTHFLVFPTGGRPSGSHTQMGWTVDDIGAEVSELKARGVGARGRAPPACPALRQEASAVGRTLLSRRNAHSGPVLHATRCRDPGRPKPGLAPTGRDDTATAGRGGSTSLVATGMDQGRDGVSPRTHTAGHAPEHRDPRSRDGPEDTAGLRGVLVLHPPGQWCDSSRGITNRRAPRGIAGGMMSHPLANLSRLEHPWLRGPRAPPSGHPNSRDVFPLQ